MTVPRGGRPATYISFLTFAVMAACFAQVSQANHIDYIVDGGFNLNTDSFVGSISGTQTGAGGNIVGGEREVSISFLGGTTGFVGAGTLGAAAGPGPVGPDVTKTMLLNNSVFARGQFQLKYDGVGTTGLGGLDFDTSWDAIAVTFDGVQGSGSLVVEVSDSTPTTGSATQTVSGAGTYTFPFTNPGYAGVNFGSVNSVVVTLNTTDPASDFSITQITREIIPEPSSAFLASLAVVAMGYVRRRRR